MMMKYSEIVCWQSIKGGSVVAHLKKLFVAVLFLVTNFIQPISAQSYTFSKFEVSGNLRIESNTILSYAGLLRNKATSTGDLNAAYRNILASGLFERVEMEPSGATLRITVVELPTLNEIVFEGNKRIKTEALRSIVGSLPRRVFSPDQAERDAAQISQAYVEAGRLAARVTPKAIRRSDNRVDLVFEIFEGGLVEINRLSFVGNKAFSDRRLRSVLDTKQAGILSTFVRKDTFIADRLEYDKQLLKDFYAARGYIDFNVVDITSELSRERDGMFLTLMLREGQQFKFGKITVVSDISNLDIDDYRNAIQIESGAVYSPRPIENGITRMERLALIQGRNFFRVVPKISRDDRNLALDVEYFLTNGPRVFVERIDINGNTSTLDSVIRRQFKIAEGDPFNPREIRESSDRIKSLGFFSQVSVQTRAGSENNKVVIEINVEEQPTGSLSFGGSYSSSMGVGGEIKYMERNFLGRGQSLALTLSGGSTSKNYRFSFNEPAFNNLDVTAGFNLESSSITHDNSAFDTADQSFSPYFGFPLTEKSSLRLGYSVAQTEVATAASSTTSIGEIIAAEVAQGAVLNSSIFYTYGYDSRRKGLNPNAGVLLRFGQEIGGLGGDNSFLKSTIQSVAQTKVLAEEVTLSATYEGGALSYFDGSSRVADRFAFGSNQMRGFRPQGIGPREHTGVIDDALRGRFYSVLRFEAGFPIGIPNEYGLSGGLFYDVGSLWGVESSSKASLSDPSALLYEDMSLRQTVGFSLFWSTPIGPLRFNFMDVLDAEDHDKTETFELTVSSKF